MQAGQVLRAERSVGWLRGFMASSFFALLDDLSTVLDDIAALSKVAAKKTSGVLGDDLALNAEQLRGIEASREAPVIWSVAKGSLRNKCILVPAALLLSELAPRVILPVLVLGGLFLCFEGVEKLAAKWLHPPSERAAAHKAHLQALERSEEALLQFEQEKIAAAVRTDFVLSAEIIVISLGTLAAETLRTRAMVLCVVAILMTVGVYGVVLGILKLDDAGMSMMKHRRAPVRHVGSALLRAAPWLMKLLSFAGTVAVFMVGGGIVSHGIPTIHHAVAALPSHPVLQTAAEAAVGVVMGALALAAVSLVQKLRGKPQAAH